MTEGGGSCAARRNLDYLLGVANVRGLSVDEIARIVERSPETVYAYRKGARPVPDGVVNLLRAFLSADLPA